MYRVSIEIPTEADDAVVKALHAAAAALSVDPGNLSESITAPIDSYSLTLHVLPDLTDEEKKIAALKQQIADLEAGVAP